MNETVKEVVITVAELKKALAEFRDDTEIKLMVVRHNEDKT